MESESCQSDFSPVDPTRSIVKYFVKCLIELTKHTESVQYKNSKLIKYDTHTKVETDDNNGYKIDITEHNLKPEFREDGSIFKQIKNLKHSIVELLTVCSQQNIKINYDLSRPDIILYTAFDDSQRVLVMNHLTLNTISIVENILNSLKLFKLAKYMENAPHIKKSFSNIYKEIKSLPTRVIILENVESSFKELTNKNEYNDTYNYLSDKLVILCKYINKFSKAYQQKCLYSGLPASEDTVDISDDNISKKRKHKRVQERSTVKMDHANKSTEPNEVFKIPEAVQKNKKEKKKTSKETQIIINDDLEPNQFEQNIDENTSNDKTNKEKKKNKREKLQTEPNDLLDTFLEKDISILNVEETINKKEKKKSSPTASKIPSKETEVITIDDNLEPTQLKQHIDKKKKKNKATKLKNMEPNNVLDTSEKVKNKNNISTKESEIITINDNLEPIQFKEHIDKDLSKDTKKKNKIEKLQNMESDNNLLEPNLSILENNVEGIKSKKNSVKHKEISNNNDDENIKLQKVDTKNKAKKNKTNTEIPIVHNNSIPTEANKGKKRKKVKASVSNEKENKKSKRLKLNGVTNDNQNNKRYSKLKSVENSDSDLNESDGVDEPDILPDEILKAIKEGNLEIDYDNQEVNDFTQIVSENCLNENEKFLFIQDMLDTFKDMDTLTDEMKEKLRNLRVLVDWPVPRAHEVGCRLTAPPTPEEKDELKSLGVSTGGMYTHAENEILRNNWKLFCKKHDFEDNAAPFIYLYYNKKNYLRYTERIKFVQFLGQGLPHKPLHSIYRRFRILSRDSSLKIGRFTPEEDQLILTYIKNINREDNKKKFARLCPLLNRTRDQIERRYRVLMGIAQGVRKKVIWNLKLKTVFINHLLQITNSNNIEELRDKNIDFIFISKLMNIPTYKLKMVWNLRMYTQLYATRPLNTDELKVKLIERFCKLQLQDWKAIKWSTIVTKFHGVNRYYLWMLIKSIVNNNVPRKLHTNLGACLEYLTEFYIPNLISRKSFGKKHALRLRLSKKGELETYV